jgi:hypothetical protein
MFERSVLLLFRVARETGLPENVRKWSTWRRQSELLPVGKRILTVNPQPTHAIGLRQVNASEQWLLRGST